MESVLTQIRAHNSRSLLEVGCGNGFLAELILQRLDVLYRGFDFSLAAVENAGSRTRKPQAFTRADALNPKSYEGDYDTIICTEVLEHIQCDLDVIRLWRYGTWCV